VAEAATILPVTPVAHPRNSVVIGGLHAINPKRKSSKWDIPVLPVGNKVNEILTAKPTRVKDPVMHIKLAGSEYSALLDTGGGLSILGWKIGARIRALDFKLVPSGREVSLTQGKVTLPYSVYIHFAWMGGSKRHTFYILSDDSEQVILGKDFLEETCIDVSISRGGWFKSNEPENITPFDTWTQEGDSCLKFPRINRGHEKCAEA
jgi:hypothetical protein